MKIAISSSGDTIAATFDFVDEVVVFECFNGKTTDKQRFNLKSKFVFMRTTELKDLGINVLICGAISNHAVFMLQHNGIEVVNGMTGEIDTIIYEFLHDNINQPRYHLPGYVEKGCTRRKTRMRQRQRGKKYQNK